MADCRLQESTAFIEKMVGKETNHNKKKCQKKPENDVVKRLAKTVLIDKDKASGIIKKTASKTKKTKKKKKKGSSSSSSSDSSSDFSSSSDSSSDSESSSSDDKKKKSRKPKPKKT